MKKLLAVLLAFSLIFCLTACGNEKTPSADETVAFTMLIKINPSIEASFNKAFKCVKLTGTNTDGQKIADKSDVIGDDLETATKEIIDACNQDKYFENNDKVSFEIKILDDTLNLNDIANNAKNAISDALKDLDIDATVEESSTNEVSSTETTTTSTTTSTTTTSATTTTSKPTSSKPTTTTSKPTTTTSKPTTATTQNPSNVKMEQEYVGKVYFVFDEENIYAPGICFYNDGGFGDGVYCLLLDAMFTSNPDDDIKDRTPVTYGGKKYYRCGAGMSPAYVSMTSTDITITQDSTTIKAVLLSDGTLKITSSNNATYPVNTILSIAWNYLS